MKIFSADEACLAEDLAELQKFLDRRESSGAVDDHIPNAAETDVSVVGNIGDSCSKALTSELYKQLKLDPTSCQSITESFPKACSFSDSSKFVVDDTEPDNAGYHAPDDKDQEFDLMDKLTQVIMSMDMRLQ